MAAGVRDDSLIIGDILGSGAFSTVYHGVWQVSAGDLFVSVGSGAFSTVYHGVWQVRFDVPLFLFHAPSPDSWFGAARWQGANRCLTAHGSNSWQEGPRAGFLARKT